MGLSFDGFKTHVKNLTELINMADALILAVCEGRDSSEINQPFDRFVARAGKRRAALTLDLMRRSHFTSIIDQWMLVLVALEMLRDCNKSRVWENSFVAVNMHPDYRVGFQDWIQKIAPFVQAANKFEKEVVEEHALLPAEWKKHTLEQRQSWIKIIDADGASWDVDMIAKLRAANMNLQLVANIYKIYQAEKRIALKLGEASTPPPPAAAATPPAVFKDKSRMIYHLYNAPVPGASPMQRFQHACTVRNRTLGPVRGTTVSPHLDVEVTPDNKRFLNLSPDDLNMHRVLRESSCRTDGKRRRVARRSLNALGGLSGMAGFLNNPERLEEIKQNLEFASSLEEIKHVERQIKESKAKKTRTKDHAAAMAKMGLATHMVVYKKHLQRTKLTIAQMKAVAYVCGGKVIHGKADQVRATLMELLPTCQDVDSAKSTTESESDTDSDTDSETSFDSDETTYGEMPEMIRVKDIELAEAEAQNTHANVTIDVPVKDMVVGDCVEVYWRGDKKWYEGRITAVDMAFRQFEVEYFLDGETLTHNEADYKVRMSC